MNRFIVAIFVFIFISFSAYAQTGTLPFNCCAAIFFTSAWQNLPMGDGGQGSGFARASDGTLLAWNNTYGAHLYKSGGTCSAWGTVYIVNCWQQLFTATSVTPSVAFPNGVNNGAVAVEVCNSNTNILYGLWNGFLWVSQNKGASWLKTSLTTTQNPNSNSLIGRGKYIACDPNNPDIVYIATPASLQVSKNGTSGSPTFATVTGVGTTGTVPSAIFFDPASATTGSCPASCYSNHLYVFTYSTGVYETYNGGTPQSGTFSLTSGGPTIFYGMDVDKFSQLWAVNGSASVFRYVPNGSAAGGTWSTSTPGVSNSQAFIIAVDPTSSSSGANRVVASYYDGEIAVSTNNAGGWTAAGFGLTVTAAAPQPTWMATANQSSAGTLYLSIVSLLFDTSGNLWGAGGIANWKVVPTISTNPVWAADTIGVEQLVGEGVIAALGNSPVTWQWDRGFMTIDNLDTYPSTYWPGAITSNIYGTVGPIEGGWFLDYASSNTNFLTGWAGGQGTTPATSSDGGKSWTVWPATPASTNVGGAVAASTSTNWVVVPGINKVMSYTTDGGATWNPITVSGTPTWINIQGVRAPVAADRGNANTFCAVDTDQNVYNSVNSGQNWTKSINTGTLDGGVGVDMLIAVPGQTAQFFYTALNASGSTPGTNKLWKITKTTNECDTAAVPNSNLTGVYAFGFGAPKPGNSYPTIYAYAYLSSVLGMYESDDIGVTWTLINVPASQQVWPKNSQDFVAWVAGDMNVYGVIYVMFRGSGGGYIQTQTSCPYVNFTAAFKPTSNLTGTVTLQGTKSGKVPVTSVSFYVDGSLIGTQSSATGTPPTYSQSWNTAGVAHGAHTLKIEAAGNGCTTLGNSFLIPITTSYLMAHDLNPANDNAPMYLNKVA